jgi:hypothetical protein
MNLGICKYLVDRFELAESLRHSDGGLVRVGGSGHKCNTSGHSSFEVDTPAQGEYRIEHRTGRPRQARPGVQRGGIGRRAAASEKSRAIGLVLNRFAGHSAGC